MKKHVLKKSMVLGSLMAFVITGSALAANVDVADGETKNEPVIAVGTNESFKNAGTVVASESITVEGGHFENTGIIKTGILNVYSNMNDNATIAGTIDVDKFIYRGAEDNLYSRGLEADIDADELSIIGSTKETGLLVKDNNVLDNVKNIIIESNGTKTGIKFEGNDLNITSNITLKGTGDARLEVDDASNVSFSGVTNKSSNGKIQVNGKSTVSVAELNVESGYLALQTNGSNAATGEFELHKVTVGEGAALRASVYQGVTPNAKITGNINIDLGKDALVDFGGMKNPDWNGERINVAADSFIVRVADTTSESKVYISSTSEIVKNADKIVIIADGANNTGNAAEDLKNAGSVLEFTTETNSDSSRPTTSAGVGATVEQEESSIFDGARGSIAEEGKINNIEIKRNTNVF